MPFEVLQHTTPAPAMKQILPSNSHAALFIFAAHVQYMCPQAKQQQHQHCAAAVLTLNHDAQVRPAEGAVGVLSHLDLALRVDQEHGWLGEGVLSLPDVAGVADIQAPPVHVCQPQAVGNAVGDLLGLCGGAQAVQLQGTVQIINQTRKCITV